MDKPRRKINKSLEILKGIKSKIKPVYIMQLMGKDPKTGNHFYKVTEGARPATKQFLANLRNALWDIRKGLEDDIQAIDRLIEE